MNRQNNSIKEFLSFLLTLIQRDDGQKTKQTLETETTDAGVQGPYDVFFCLWTQY